MELCLDEKLAHQKAMIKYLKKQLKEKKIENNIMNECKNIDNLLKFSIPNIVNSQKRINKSANVSRINSNEIIKSAQENLYLKECIEAKDKIIDQFKDICLELKIKIKQLLDVNDNLKMENDILKKERNMLYNNKESKFISTMNNTNIRQINYNDDNENYRSNSQSPCNLSQLSKQIDYLIKTNSRNKFTSHFRNDCNSERNKTFSFGKGWIDRKKEEENKKEEKVSYVNNFLNKNNNNSPTTPTNIKNQNSSNINTCNNEIIKQDKKKKIKNKPNLNIDIPFSGETSNNNTYGNTTFFSTGHLLSNNLTRNYTQSQMHSQYQDMNNEYNDDNQDNNDSIYQNNNQYITNENNKINPNEELSSSKFINSLVTRDNFKKGPKNVKIYQEQIKTQQNQKYRNENLLSDKKPIKVCGQNNNAKNNNINSQSCLQNRAFHTTSNIKNINHNQNQNKKGRIYQYNNQKKNTNSGNNNNMNNKIIYTNYTNCNRMNEPYQNKINNISKSLNFNNSEMKLEKLETEIGLIKDKLDKSCLFNTNRCHTIIHHHHIPAYCTSLKEYQNKYQNNNCYRKGNYINNSCGKEYTYSAYYG